MRSILTAASLAVVVLLSACASGEPKPKAPIRLELAINAASDVNPDDRGHAAPIVVRLYELKNGNAFEAADFFSLETQEKTVLAADVVKRDQFQLRPRRASESCPAARSGNDCHRRDRGLSRSAECGMAVGLHDACRARQGVVPACYTEAETDCRSLGQGRHDRGNEEMKHVVQRNGRDV